MPNNKVYRDQQHPLDLRVAFWLLHLNARVIPGKECRENFIAQVEADLLSEPDAYEGGLLLNVFHCAFVGVTAVAINEISFGCKRKLEPVITAVKTLFRKTRSDINHIEQERNQKKSVACKGYILCREAFEIVIKKIKKRKDS